MKLEARPTPPRTLLPRPSTRHTRPEPLETRVIPATVTFIGGPGAFNWNVGSNWSNGTGPAAGDDVVIDTPGGPTNVTLNVNASLNSISVLGDDGLIISASIGLGITGFNSTIHNLNLSGSLGTSAPLELSGTGAMHGESTLGGSGTVTVSGTLNIADGSPNLTAALSVTGTLNIGNSYFDFQSGSVVTVENGGVLDTSNSVSGYTFRESSGGTSPGVTINGGGILRHSGGGAFRAEGVPMSVNGGIVEITGGGDLQFNSGGTFANATFIVAAGGRLLFDDTSATVAGFLTGTGGGTVRLGSGVLGMAPGGATFNFPAGMFSWGSEGRLAGPGTLTIANALNVTDGSPNLATNLVVTGTVIHGNSYLDFEAGSSVGIGSGGTYQTTNSVSGYTFRNQGGGGVTVNAGGAFAHSGSGQFRTDGVPFNVNGGTVHVTGTGDLQLNSGGTWTNATFDVAPGQTLRLDGTSAAVVGTLTGTGSGTVRFGAGTLTMGAGATFDFPTGMFSWGSDASIAGGTLTNIGTIHISDGSPNLQTLLVNAGTILHGNSYFDFLTANAEVRNLAGSRYETTNSVSGYTFRNLSGGATLGLVTEAGAIFRHSGSGSFRTDGVPFNVSGGTVNVTGTGDLQLNSGGTWTNATFDVASGQTLRLDGAGASVAGTLTGVSGGTVRFGSGMLTMGAGATFDFPTGMFSWGSDASIAGSTLTNVGTIHISDGSPNLHTLLVNAGTILHGNSYFDFLTANAEVRNLAGSLYETSNSVSGYTFRNLSGGATLGLVTEAGAIFRHSGSGSFRTDGVPFNVNGGTVNVTGAGDLQLNSGGTFTDAIFSVSSGQTLRLDGTGALVVGKLTGVSGGTVRFGAGTLTMGANAMFNFPTGMFSWGSDASITGGTLTNTGTIHISDGSPNLHTKLLNAGIIAQGNSYFDFLTANAEVRNLAGSLYETSNSVSGYTFRNLSGGATIGLVTEAGAIFRHSGSGQFRTDGVPFSVSGGTVSVTGTGPLQLNSGGIFAGARFDVTPTHTLSLDNTGATVDGPLTGSGGGTVRLGGGTLNIGTAGATFRFPAGMFSWGGEASIGGGTLTNAGTLHFTDGSPNLNTLLLNQGTIVHGNAYLDFTADQAAVRNLEGSLYNTTNSQNNWAFREFAPGTPQGVFVEAGATFRHSGGGQFLADGVPFSNLGTVETTSATLVLPSVAQVVNGALTAGRWNILGGSLNITGATITTNATHVTLGGGFTGFSPSLNIGTIELRNGVDFTKTGAFTNTGTLRLGPGSVFTVGNFTQSTGTTEFQIGGTDATGIGRVVSTAAATLGGTARLALTGGFSPVGGVSYTFLTFPTKTGAFVKTEGLFLGHEQVFETFTDDTQFRANTIIDAANLAVTAFTSPGAGTAGQGAAFSYTVQNTGAFATSIADWVDSIYLSRDGVLDASDVLVARVPHSGVLGANGTYTQNLNLPLPGALPGTYQVLVLADSRGLVADSSRANNLSISATPLTLDVPTLTEGAAFNGTISDGQDLFFRVVMPAEKGRTFTLTSDAGEAGLAVQLASIPGRFTGDGFSANNSITQRINLPGGSAGEFYIHLFGKAGANSNFVLIADALDLGLSALSNPIGANKGTVTTTVTGSEFSPDTVFTLLPVGGGANIPASQVVFKNSTTVFVTFDLAGAATGAYDVRASDGPAIATLPGGFGVTAGAAGALNYSISSPRFIRPPFRGIAATLTYTNTGGTDIEAPYFTIASTNALVQLEGQTNFNSGEVAVLGINPNGLAGVLPPGATGTINIFFQPENATPLSDVVFQAQVSGVDNDVMDWSQLKDILRPHGMPADAWNAVYANFTASVGDTFGEFHDALLDNANYLSALGQASSDVMRLLGFELEQAGEFGELARRWQTSALGRGNETPFSEHLEFDSSGNATFVRGSEIRGFVATVVNNLTTFTGVGFDELGRLIRNSDGTFTLTEANGVKMGFLANGKLAFNEDTNGNRLTSTYNATGQLTSVTDSASGDITTFAYNAAGLISTITDPVGRATSYTYDVAGHVTAITTPQGTAGFTYVTGQGPAREHAIASITGYDGVVTTFGYDPQGRITSRTTGSGPGAVAETFSYDSAGRLTLSDAAGSTDVYRIFGGLVARSVDPLGNVAQASYDSGGRITGVQFANGASALTGYGAAGLTSIKAPGQGAIKYTFGGANQRITGVTGPGGDALLFGYDTDGNLTNETFADGTGRTLTYDAQGRVTSQVNANGIIATYTYTAANLVDRIDYSDGSFLDYGYDARRNLVTATDAEGTTTLTYDNADHVLSIAYPNNTSVTFTYDAAGRRTTMTDHTGFTVRYAYDPLGRLDRVSDTGDATLVDYSYDAAGRLATETRGNGATTTYAYDAKGRTTGITHRDAASVVLDSFTYSYDAIGRVRTVASNTGVTTYGYDFAGQLVFTELPGGHTITYNYDADGNRIATTDNGTPVIFAVNNLEQYTAAGLENFTYDQAGRLVARAEGTDSTSLQYDAQGRLVTVITASGTTHYDYDALGYRIGIVENGTRTDFAYDPSGLGGVFGEYGAGGNTHYASGLGLVGAVGAGGSSYFHFDAIGNTALLTGSGGTVQNTYGYLPFGEIAAQTGTTTNRFTFNGREGVQDDGDGSYFMRARNYDAGLGRFIQRDPIGLLGGDTNLYRFVGNDPINSTDPSGFDDFYLAGGAELTAGGGFNVQGGGFISTDGLLDSGVFVSGGVSVGVNGGVSVVGGYTPDLSGTANNLNYGAGVVTGSTQLDDNGVPIGQSGGASFGLPGGASFSTGYGVKITPRGILNGLGFDLPKPPTAEEIDAINNQFNNFVREKTQDPLVADLYRRFLPNSADRQEALLDAIRAANKLRQENPGLFDPPPVKKTTSTTVRPGDPNNIVGPSGPGADPILGDVFVQPVRYDGFVNGANTFGYTVLFENMPTATAPAQIVKVTQQLDDNLDMSTFALGTFGWGDFKVTAPAGLNAWSTRVDATASLGIFVDVEASLNPATRELLVTYTSIDPATGDVPENPFSGFLPPNLTTPEGDGFLTYTVAPQSGLTNGTRFDAVATIYFDYETPINTPAVHNLLDNVAPTSAVTPFASATTSRTKFRVNWTAADETGGSGLLGTTIYYRDNGGPLTAVTIADPGNAAAFIGGQVGHTYTFFSRALDGVSNEEALGALPDATITVVAPTLVSNKLNGKLRTFTDADGDTYTVALTGPGTLNAVLLDPDGDGKGSIDQLFLTGSTVKSKVTVAVKKNKNGGDGSVAIGDLNVTGDLRSFTAKASDLTVDGVIATGEIGAVSVRDLVPADALVATPGIQAAGAADSRTKFSLTARNIADGTLINAGNSAAFIKAASIGDGRITLPALGSLATSVGAMNADLVIAGAVGPISVKTAANSSNWDAAKFGPVIIGTNLNADLDTPGSITSILIKNGSLTGQITARNVGAITITGGSLSGLIASTTPAATLGKTLALGKLTITGGDLAGDIALLGAAGPITVKASKTGSGGNITDINITAAKIAALSVAKNVTNSFILAGTVLGTDQEPGGGDDTFAPGTIGAIKVGGNILASVVAAGLSNPDGSPNNADDIVLGGTTSKIAKLIVKGGSITGSYFASGQFTANPKVGTTTVDVTANAQFRVA